MLDKKQYLKNLLIVKRNLEIFLKSVKCLDDSDYFEFKTSGYLEVINNEILYVKRELEDKDNTFYSQLTSIYDFGV